MGIKSGARVNFAGYTDRIGDVDRNKALAKNRALNAATALKKWLEKRGVRDIALNVAGVGVETERFDNDLPEGRALSRGVEINIDQATESGNSKPGPAADDGR